MKIAHSIKDNKIRLTEKLFYKRFPYRLSFKFPMVTTQQFLPFKMYDRYGQPSTSIQNQRIDRDSPEYIRTATKLDYILKTFPTDSFTTRTEKEIALFLLTLEQVELILSHTGIDRVSCLTKPINKKHYDLLKDNTTLIFKKDKFWKNYNIKVNLKYSDNFKNKTIPWLLEFLNQNENKKAYRVNAPLGRMLKAQDRAWPHLHRQDLFLGHSLYIETEEDLMMMKLAIGEDIASVYRVILFEELGEPQESY